MKKTRQSCQTEILTLIFLEENFGDNVDSVCESKKVKESLTQNKIYVLRFLIC